MIAVCNVAKVYLQEGGGVAITVLCDVNFVVGDGDFVVISGHPGSGKTTLLNVMAGLTLPTTGRVLYDGVEPWKLPDPEQTRFRNEHVGFVFQFPSLMPSLTVLENVLVPTTFFGGAGDAGERTRRGMELLKEVALADVLGAYPRELSVGQQQRLVIARALINQPRVLYADEPAGDLDADGQHQIMQLLRDLHLKLGVTVVMVTRNHSLAKYATHSFLMMGGQMLERGPLPRISGVPAA